MPTLTRDSRFPWLAINPFSPPDRLHPLQRE